MSPSSRLLFAVHLPAFRRLSLPMPNHTPPQLFLIDGYALIYRAFLRDDLPAAPDQPRERTPPPPGAWSTSSSGCARSTGPTTSPGSTTPAPRSASERYPEYKSTREKLDDELQADFDRAVERICAAARGLPDSARGHPRLRGRRRHRHPGPGRRRRAASARSSSRATRTSISSSGPASPCSIPAAAARRRWTRSGSTSPTPPSGWACRRRQVVDFLALVGDSSDNIPGVKGIGEKGAQKLLAEFGDLETILARAAEVTAKRTREALLAQAENARLSRELVTIKRDVPVELDVGDLVLQEPDREAAHPDPHRARVLLPGRGWAGRAGRAAPAEPAVGRRSRPSAVEPPDAEERRRCGGHGGSPAATDPARDRRRLAGPRRAARARGHRGR